MDKPKTSRSVEWLKLPKKVQKKFAKNYLNISVDYLQFTSYDISLTLRNLYSLGFSGEIDMDNSNVEYNADYNLSLTHNNTNMGHAYMVSFLSPGFPPIPVLSVEVYNPNQIHTLKTEGKVVFYGAFFVFNQLLQEEVPGVISFFNSVDLGRYMSDTRDNKPKYKCTRVDIALDVAVPVDQKWMSHYIRPHKTSKHVPKPYNYQPELGGWQSIKYIPRLTRGIGIRIYNKLLDIQSKHKEFWYPHYGTEETPIVTRVEVVYAGDVANKIRNELLEYTKFRLLGQGEITQLIQVQNPKSEYTPLNAYEYFKRYAKNHGKTVDEVIYDVSMVHLESEFQRNS